MRERDTVRYTRRMTTHTSDHASGSAADVNAPSRYLSPGQVAALFGVDVATVRRWAKAGRIPSHRRPSGRLTFLEVQITPLVPVAPQEAGA